MILHNSCPLCRQNNLRPYALDTRNMKPHISRVKCSDCSLVFANPMADGDELNDFYQNYYENGYFGLLHYKEKVKQLFEKVANMPLDLLNREAYFLNKFGENSNEGKFLDVGCGLGIGLVYAKRYNYQLYATELDADAISFVKDYFHVKVYHGELLNADYPDNYFDYIYINHVIEHVLDPVAYMQFVQRILKPGGIVFIGTPNISSFIYRAYRVVSFLRCRIPGIVDGLEHTFLFNKRTLKFLGENSNLEMVYHRNLVLGETLKNIIKSNLPFIKKIARYAQTFFYINQEMIFKKPTK